MTNEFKSQAQEAPTTHALAIVSLILSIFTRFPSCSTLFWRKKMG